MPANYALLVLSQTVRPAVLPLYVLDVFQDMDQLEQLAPFATSTIVLIVLITSRYVLDVPLIIP